MTDLTTLIQHPELLNKETLYDLRSVIALHPYYQPARFLLLRNLYLLHDSSFDDELRRAAMFITDRKLLFELIEGAHYRKPSGNPESVGCSVSLAAPELPEPIASTTSQESVEPSEQLEQPQQPARPAQQSRTTTLIDTFLETLPQEEPKAEKRKPTPADATVDYVAYLLETSMADSEPEAAAPAEEQKAPSRTATLIDTFINEENGRMTLQDETEYEPEETAENDENGESEDFFTETLAQIYIKQGRYSKALEIIRRLNLIYPKKNRYFADQIRFLEKLILNNNK